MVKVSCRCKSHHVYLCNFLSLLSAKGVMQLASRSERKINIVLPLKKRAYMIQYRWCQLPV